MRKKNIEYDGTQFTISPLTFDQSEEVITRPRPAGVASFTAACQWFNAYSEGMMSKVGTHEFGPSMP